MSTATKMRQKPVKSLAVSCSPKKSTEISAPNTAYRVRSMAAVEEGV